MQKALKDFCEACALTFTSRPILMLALVHILAIEIVFGIEGVLNIGDEYNEYHPNNPMSRGALLAGDNSSWCGRVEDIRHRSINGEDTYTVILGDVTWKDYQLSGAGKYIHAYMKSIENINIGSYIIVKGRLHYYEHARNHGEFDLYDYYSHRGYLFAIKDATLLQYSYEYDHLKNWLYACRGKIAQILENQYSDEDAAILKAMLLGVKEEIDTELKESFQKNGIAHILAISGLHISFLCMTLYTQLIRLGVPLQISVILCEIILVMYILMVGFSPSAFRAAIMFSMFLISRILKRSYDMISSVSVASIVILLINPGYIKDTSYQLSFWAIIAVGFFYKIYLDNSCNLKEFLDKPASGNCLKKIRERLVNKLINGLLVSIWVYLVTLPVLLKCYYETAFYSILLNIVVVPLMSVLLMAAILGLLMTTAVNFVALPFYELVKCILNFYKEMCRILEHCGAGRINLGQPSWKAVLIYYILLVVICVYRGKRRAVFQLLAVICCMSVMSFHYSSYPRLYMLDVGQGDCIVYIGNKRETYLFDGGSSSKRNVGSKRIIPFLKYNGIKRIDGIFLSHPDSDHINGIEELIELSARECIEIDCIYAYSEYLDNEGYQRIKQLAKENGIEIAGIHAGMQLEDGMLSIKCIYPLSSLAPSSDNNSSLVLRLEYGDFSFLDMGDLEMESETEILDIYAGQDLKADVLKVAHHGSSSSSSSEFIRSVAPKVSLISAGINNRYGHPHTETIQTLNAFGSDIQKTGDCGEICLVITKKGREYAVYKYLDILE